MIRVLIVEDDPVLGRTLARTLQLDVHVVGVAATISEALRRLEIDPVDVVGDVIPVGSDNGRFDKLVVVVLGADVEISGMVVHLKKGSTWVLETRRSSPSS